MKHTVCSKTTQGKTSHLPKALLLYNPPLSSFLSAQHVATICIAHISSLPTLFSSGMFKSRNSHLASPRKLWTTCRVPLEVPPSHPRGRFGFLSRPAPISTILLSICGSAWEGSYDAHHWAPPTPVSSAVPLGDASSQLRSVLTGSKDPVFSHLTRHWRLHRPRCRSSTLHHISGVCAE